MNQQSLLIVLASLSACAHAPAPCGDVTPTAPTELCKDPTLRPTGFCMPSVRIEALLRASGMSILEVRGTTHGITGAQVVLLQFPNESLVIRSKWKEAKHGGSAVNNDPRKELAAYEVQKLLLDPNEYVIPPTVARCLPLDLYKTKLGAAQPTFEGTDCVFGVFAYWVENVIELPPLDKQRFAENKPYRAALANMNLVSYLINHRDTRPSNFVLSRERDTPRALSIDNGMAFSGVENARTILLGEWRTIVVPQLPQAKLERLRRVTRSDLDKLGVVAEFEVRDHQLVPAVPGAPLGGSDGVRLEGAVLQLGLTKLEIDGLEARIKALLRDADSGKIEVY